MIRSHLLLLLTLISLTASSQVTSPWAESFFGPSSNEFIGGVEIVDDEHVFISGYSGDDITLDTVTYTGSNFSFAAFFFDNDDSLAIEWSRKISSNGSVVLNNSAIDSDKSRIVCGMFSGSQCNLQDTTLSGNFSTNASNIFIAKWDSNGTFQWARGIPGFQLTSPSITTDQDGNIAMVFMFLDSVTIDSTTYFNSNGTGQSFFGNRNQILVRLTPEGETSWVKHLENSTFFYWYTNFYDGSTNVAFDSEGSVYVASTSITSMTIDSTSVSLSTSVYDIALAKIDSSGVVQWMLGGGASSTSDLVGDLLVYDDEVFLLSIVNGTNDTLSFGSTSAVGDVFIGQFSSSGNVNQIIAGSGGIAAGRISFDDEGGLYLLGGANSTLISFGNISITSQSASQTFVVKRNTVNDQWEWGESFNTSGFFTGDVAARKNNNLYIAGRYGASVTFGNNTLFAGTTPQLYVAKLSDCTQLEVDYLGQSNDTSVCAGETVTLTAATQTGYEVQWNLNGSALAGQTNASYTATQSGEYSFTIDSAGCIATSDPITIDVGSPINVTHANIPPVCNLDSPVTLSGGSPAGGTYSGSGIVNGNQFNPALASVGSNTIWYVYTDSIGCSDSVSKNVQVNLNPSILSTSVSLCENDDPLSLFNFLYGFPLGGTHAGPGISGSSFVPSSVGPGTYAIEYTYNGCPASDSIVITVESAPNVSLMAPDSACFSSTSPFLLMGTPTGGTYAWNNVNSQLFYPNFASPGTVLATYTVTVNGCTAIDTAEIFIDTIPTLNVLPIGPFCANDATVSLDSTAVPAGGVFTLAGNQVTSISPSVEGPSTNELIYTFNNVCGTYADSQMVVINEVPDFTVAVDDVDCFGNATGAIALTMTAGTAPFTFDWSNSTTGAFQSNLAAGGYTVEVTDSNGCSIQSSTIQVNEPQPLSLSFSVDSVSCNGFQDGTISSVVSGGTAPYSYAWSNGSSANDVDSLSAGTYSLTVTDNNGCTETGSVTLTDPIVFAVDITETIGNDCFGDANAELSVSPTTGNTIAVLSWSTGANTASIGNLAAGTYSVTATNPNGCEVTESFTVLEPAPISLDSSLIENASCNGGEDGALYVNAIGGTGTLLYVWDTGDSTQQVVNLGEATYAVEITDDNGCTLTDSFAVTAPFNVVDVVTDSLKDISCFGAQDGFISAVSTGGTAPFDYVWSTGSTASALSGLDSGLYKVTITDAVGCADTLDITLVSPSALEFGSASLTNNSCAIETSGVLSLEATGGVLPYTYAWSNGATTSTNTGLSSGTYSLTLTDSNGCTIDTSLTVIYIDSIAPTAAASNITIYLDSLGQVTIDFASVDNGSSDNCGIAETWLSTTTFNCAQVGQNVIEVAVEDSSGNTDSTLAVVTVLDTFAPSVVVQNLTVYLDANGGATITALALDNGTNDACGIDSIAVDQSSFDCSDLGVNTVTFSAIDVHGNVSTANADVTVIDTTSPTVVTQNLTVYLDATGTANIASTQVDAGSSDNCSFSLSLGDSTFTCADTGSQVVTLTATDGSGNIAFATAQIIVLDTLAPEVITQNQTVYLDVNGSASLTTAMIDNGSSDNCGFVLSLSDTLFGCEDVGSQSVTLTAIDGSGNISTATANVMVMDTIPPTAIAQNLTVFLDENGTVTITPSQVDSGSTDNCSIDSLALDITSFDCSTIGENTVILTVIDSSANSDTVSAIVTVVDTLSPIVSANDITVYLDSNGTAVIDPSSVDNGSTDHCSLTLSLSRSSFTCADEGFVSVALIGNDSSGNSTVDSFTVEVIDTLFQLGTIIGPTALTQGDSAVYFVDSIAGASYQWSIVNGTALSNGSGSVVIWDANALQGEVMVVQTVAQGCLDSTSINVELWPTGWGEHQAESKVILFPNPTRGKLYFALDQGEISNATVSMYSSLGQLVLTEPQVELSAERYELDLSGLAVGTYTVAIQHRGTSLMYRVILQ